MDELPVDDRPFLPGQILFPWAADDVPSAPKQRPTPDGALTPSAVEEDVIVEETEVSVGASLAEAEVETAVETTTVVEKAKPAEQKSAKKRPAKQKAASRTAASTNAAANSKTEAGKVTVRKTKAAKTKKPASTKRNPTKSTVQGRASRNSKNTETSQQNRKSYQQAMEHLPLKWGAQLPKVGFGFWKVDKDRTSEVCRSAIEVGYRHLDCACDYGNETEVGQGINAAIKDGLCEREDLWVTSKLWNTYHAPEHVQQACEKSLDDLGLNYLDLYLVHFPIAQRFVPFEKSYPPGWFFDADAANPVVEEARVPMHETWQAMEELAKSGLVRNIGICNFGTSQLRDVLSYAKIRPAVLQVETHPYLTQEKLRRYCDQEKIAYTAFSPLGAQSYFSLGMADPSEAVMESDVVKNIAAATSKTPAQVLLRWGVQRGTAVIPKTSRRERMEENINVFDFELTDDQMNAISGLDQSRRFNDPGDFGESAFNTFLPIYE